MTATLSELALALAARGERGLMEEQWRSVSAWSGVEFRHERLPDTPRTDVDSLEIVAAMRRAGHRIVINSRHIEVSIGIEIRHGWVTEEFDPLDAASMRAALIEAATKALGAGPR